MHALPPGTCFVDAFVVDLNGIPRGKRIPAADWPSAALNGIAFSASALVLDARGHNQGPLGIGTADGDPDALGRIVPGTIQPVPWSQHKIAQCLLSMHNTWFDPRAILQNVVDRCRADGLHPVAACELEFTLVTMSADGTPAPPPDRQGRTAGNAGHLCLQAVEDQAAMLHGLHDALHRQGIDAGVLVSEYGPGQFELNLRHTPDPLRAADEAALLRRATIGVAASLGQRASFMAKPYAEHSGNGLHIHLSITDADGMNVFPGPGGQLLLEHAVAGMQTLHAPAMALFAANFSAWRRFRPGAFVAQSSTWGENNRAAAFRIPTGLDSARRIEHRVAGADASPHLVMAAILAGAHYGITHKLTPQHPDAVKLPTDIFDALRRFEQHNKLHEYLPTNYPALFTAVKRGETQDLLEAVQPIEHAFYL